jgi:hypothetical protein
MPRLLCPAKSTIIQIDIVGRAMTIYLNKNKKQARVALHYPLFQKGVNSFAVGGIFPLKGQGDTLFKLDAYGPPWPTGQQPITTFRKILNIKDNIKILLWQKKNPLLNT